MVRLSIKIAPSILSADFTCLGMQVDEAIQAGADLIHVDVMDGHFVPNLTIGPLIVSALRPICSAAGIPLDVHLMVEQPESMIPVFAHAGADILIVHIEACPHVHRTIQQIRELGVRAGVTLNPGTPLDTLDEILGEVDQVLVMSVNPGYAGQGYLTASTERISRLRQMLEQRQLNNVEIEVDGGIYAGNAREIVVAGATILVAGSAIFNKVSSIAENISNLRMAVTHS